MPPRFGQRCCKAPIECAADIRPEHEIRFVARLERSFRARMCVVSGVEVMAREMAERSLNLRFALRPTAGGDIIVGGFGDAERGGAGAR
tara:strand:- start:218 stop:484 length:267 start_codon:yes stop_codon:yes gene_type:complete